MLNRNELIIKLFLALYLVSICVYICVSWSCAYMVYVFVFSCFPCYFWCWQWLRHSVYLPFQCLIRRIDSIYNCSPCEVSVPNITVSSHSFLAEFVDWYMYVYMYFWERRRCCVTIWFYNFREKFLCHDTLTFY